MIKNKAPLYLRDKIIDKTGFLEKARLHQSEFRENKLNVSYDKYGNYLTKKDALKGLNFYDDFGIFQEVQNRYPNYKKPLYANMLRSEHIGFNLFVPLKKYPDLGVHVLNEFLNNSVSTIDNIQVEYAPSPATKYLNDRTSFDVYIEYTHSDKQKGVIGIEVKYTEHEYKLRPGSKEEFEIKNKNSRYFCISEKSQLYKADAIPLLYTDKYRQIWRNQLLGESILIEDKDSFEYFTSLTIFPKANVHFVETSNLYIDMLVSNDNKFLPVTYEEFIAACRKHCRDEKIKKWIKYLNGRYLV